MNPLLDHAQIHRFQDQVAIYIRGKYEKGTTVYLTPEQATRLGRNLLACGDDIAQRAFIDSAFPTVTVDP